MECPEYLKVLRRALAGKDEKSDNDAMKLTLLPLAVALGSFVVSLYQSGAFQ